MNFNYFFAFFSTLLLAPVWARYYPRPELEDKLENDLKSYIDENPRVRFRANNPLADLLENMVKAQVRVMQIVDKVGSSVASIESKVNDIEGKISQLDLTSNEHFLDLKQQIEESFKTLADRFPQPSVPSEEPENTSLAEDSEQTSLADDSENTLPTEGTR